VIKHREKSNFKCFLFFGISIRGIARDEDILRLMKRTSIFTIAKGQTLVRNLMTVPSAHQPFLLKPGAPDWTKDVVEAQDGLGLSEVKSLVETLPRKINVLVLYGSLREK
jgi:hypothetical protein